MSEDRERFKTSFKFDPSGTKEQQQVKPRIAVLDQFYPEHETDLQGREQHLIKSRRDIDRMLKENPLRLSFQVNDALNQPAAGEPNPLQVDLEVESLKDLTPGGITQKIRERKGEQNPELKAALQMLDATRLVRAKLAAGNKKDLQFIQDVVKAAAKKMNQAESPQSGELRKQVEQRATRSILDLVRPPKAPVEE